MCFIFASMNGTATVSIEGMGGQLLINANYALDKDNEFKYVEVQSAELVLGGRGQEIDLTDDRVKGHLEHYFAQYFE